VKRVFVVDYGMGNLFSVVRALERCGARVELASTAQAVESAPGLLLPGVGAFADGMRGLSARGLVGPLRRFAASGRPLLGICLGMQMLFEASEEFGCHEGLGVLPGNVVPVPGTDVDGQPLKVPHIGWSALRPALQRPGWKGTPLATLRPRTSMYFVHSFVASPRDNADLLAECDYGGWPLVAAVARGAVFGCQFHPEKSGPAGLAVLEGFVRAVG
jgi:glutamine amidotransferase